MVADLVKQDMADVTIYGYECEYCGETYETVDNLVRHLINHHDQMWDYEKPAEESLRCIKLDKKLLKNLTGSDLIKPGGGSINCKFCGKSFRILDGIAQHVMFNHPAVAVSAYQHGGLYLSAEFLSENKFVDHFEEYCRSYNCLETTSVGESSKAWNGLSGDLEEIESEDEWEIEEKCENDFEEEPKESEVTRENPDSDSRESGEESNEETEVFREDLDQARDICESRNQGSFEVSRLLDVSLKDITDAELQSCDKCGEVYNTEENLKNHLARYHETEERCMFCSFRGSQMDLIDHLASDCDIDEDKKQRVSELEKTCKECCYVLDTVDDLRTHVEEYHEGSENCMFCPFTGSKVDLVAHLSSDCEVGEARERIVNKPENEESCHKCGDVFGTVEDLKTHVKRYHEGYESCMFCQFKGSKMDLVAHLSRGCETEADVEHEVSEPANTCKECGKSVNPEVALEEHMRVHSHSKSYRCHKGQGRLEKDANLNDHGGYCADEHDTWCLSERAQGQENLGIEGGQEEVNDSG